MLEVYLFFIQASLQTFVILNRFLQRDDPLLPFLSTQIRGFLNELAYKFLLLSEIREARNDYSQTAFTNREKQLAG